MISLSNLLAYVDKLSLQYFTADSTSAATAAGEMSAAALASGDLDFCSAMAGVIKKGIQNVTSDVENGNRTNDDMQALNGYLAVQGPLSGQFLAGTSVTWSSLTSYALYQNQQLRDSCLFSPNTAEQNRLRNKSILTLLFDPSCVFCPQTTFATVSVGASSALTFVAGSTIRTVNNTAALDLVNGNQGYTPSKGLLVLITSILNGSLPIQVTGNGRASNGTTFIGHTWTGTLSAANAVNSTVLLTPTNTGDRLSQVTGIVTTGSPTASSGGFSLISQMERVITL